MNDLISIVSQAFYGNRTGTEIDKKNVDRFILGYIDNSISLSNDEKIDRTIINIPDIENVVIVYNKYQEENVLNNSNEAKPLVIIPEKNIKIYSRCIVCRINNDGELCSLQNGDYEQFVKYLTE